MHKAPNAPEKLIGITSIVNMLQRSRASIYRDIARGAFPKALKLGHSSRWRQSEVDAYVESLSAQR
jgi:predicted DNA-binding transcriptional regulator AlpA